MKYSIVIPVYNENENIGILSDEILATVKQISGEFQIIFVDDGSNDGTFNEILKAREKVPGITGIQLQKNYGKSTAYSVGFENAEGDAIITMDGDLQDNPNDIHKFIEKLNENYDVVVGRRKNRTESAFFKLIPSKIFNYISKLMFGSKIQDANCGFKILKKEVAKNLNLLPGFHRYLPHIAKNNGFKITEVITENRPRKYGKTKYGYSRIFSGLLDLLELGFLTKYYNKPLKFFGPLGGGLLSVGILIELAILYYKFVLGDSFSQHIALLLLGILLILVGIQIFSIGLVSELINFNFQRQKAIIKKLVR